MLFRSPEYAQCMYSALSTDLPPFYDLAGHSSSLARRSSPSEERRACGALVRLLVAVLPRSSESSWRCCQPIGCSTVLAHRVKTDVRVCSRTDGGITRSVEPFELGETGSGVTSD